VEVRFKSIKSLVKIKLQGGMPRCTWNLANSREYGFYSNVIRTWIIPAGPRRPSGAWENSAKRQTLMFNGYGDPGG